jgi:hypothetical protein
MARPSLVKAKKFIISIAMSNDQNTHSRYGLIICQTSEIASGNIVLSNFSLARHWLRIKPYMGNNLSTCSSISLTNGFEQVMGPFGFCDLSSIPGDGDPNYTVGTIYA